MSTSGEDRSSPASARPEGRRRCSATALSAERPVMLEISSRVEWLRPRCAPPVDDGTAYRSRTHRRGRAAGATCPRPHVPWCTRRSAVCATKRSKERGAVETRCGVAGAHAPRDLVERQVANNPRRPHGAHSVSVAHGYYGAPSTHPCARDATPQAIGHRLGGVLFRSSTIRGVEIAEYEEVDASDTRLGRASAHRFVKMGVNEDRRRHRRLLRQLEGPLS